MNESWWFEVIIFLILITGTICVVLATWYDLRQARLRRRWSPRLSRRVQVSVIIDARSSEGLADCIRSVRRLRYRQCDIVVTTPNNIHKEQKRAIRNAALGSRVYIARKQVSKEARICNAYRRSQHGDLVLLLDASQTVVALSLAPSIRTLQESGRAGVVLSPALQQPVSMYELATFLGNLTWRFMMKAASAAGVYRSSALFSGRLVRREVVTKLGRYRYAFDSITTLRGTRVSEWLFLRIVGYIAVAIACAVMVYAGALAAQLQTVEPLWLVWVIATSWIVVVVWLDDSIRFWQRVECTLYLPVSYFVIMSTVITSTTRKLLYRRLF